MEKSEIEAAQRTWDTIDISEVRDVAWTAFPAVNDYIARSFYPDPAGAIRKVVLNNFSTFGEISGVTLVCGDMESERGYFERLMDSDSPKLVRIDGFDLSPESLSRVRPIGNLFHPHVADCNSIKLESNEYALAVVSHGAHHIMELQHFFGELAESLKVGGVLFYYEWIGPKYLQIPRRNRFFAAFLLQIFFRKSNRTTHMGKVKGWKYLQDPPDSFDPSEACNSLQLRPALSLFFDDIRTFKHGGLLYPMLEGLGSNSSVQRRRRTLKTLCILDKLLMKMKLIHPVFEVGLAVKKVI